MKTLGAFAAICFLLLFIDVSSVRSQSREVGGYTVVMGAGAGGPQVCLGTWQQSSSITQPGSCSGELVGVSELTAISSRQTVDELDRLLETLTSIDQRLAVNNDEIKQLVEATTASRTSVEDEGRKVGELLRQTIADKFNALSVKTLAIEEIGKLKEDLLKDVDRLYSLSSAPPQE